MLQKPWPFLIGLSKYLSLLELFPDLCLSSLIQKREATKKKQATSGSPVSPTPAVVRAPDSDKIMVPDQHRKAGFLVQCSK